ncbi:alpha/beta fold hydrolase [Hymenobacter terricola]|uniref:alpha/beta fold hydrolase n=1 Tax=Hymenobacter terricola TaxID=2819236 RepID=UPI001B307D0F|nr:alpha/beta fold hydrolase [Hymenobacter terricola]
MPIQIVIIQPGVNKLIATLDLPAKRLSSIPASVTMRNDTVVFYAARADCRFACVPSADGKELRGTWVQPGLRVPLILRRFVEGAAPVLANGQAGTAKVTTYHIEAVTLTSQPGNVPLAGTLSIPDGPGPFPAAVLLSDMGSQDRDERQGNYRLFADIASTLARQGIAVLRLDDRGVGQSGGGGSLITTAGLVKDAEAGLSFLRLRPSIDPARTGLIGHGEGGNVALLAAAQPVPPSFVVALAASGLPGAELLANQAEPVANPADTAQVGAARRQAWADVLSKAAKLRASGSNAAQVETYVAQQRQKIKAGERKQVEGTLKFRRTMLGIVQQTPSDDQAQAIVVNMLRQRYPGQDPALARSRAEQLITPWYRYYLKFDPQLGLADVQCPVLLLNGTDDAEVNAAANLSALEKGLKGNKRVTARRLPGINHWFQTPAAERLAAADGTVDPVVAPVLLDTVRDWVLKVGDL